MKNKFFHSALLFLFALAQPAFAQDQLLLTDAAPTLRPGLDNTRNAGFLNLEKYLREHLVYPELAQKNGVEGPVTIKTTIGSEGEILSVELVQGIGFGCDEKVMELVSNMPPWTPAVKNGHRVPQKVFIRAYFRLK